MSDDVSMPPSAPDQLSGVAIRLAAVAERQKAQSVTLERLETEIGAVDKRLRRLEWVGIALAASGLLGGGVVGSLVTGFFGGG